MRERALGLKPDSAWITARTSAGSTPCALAATSMGVANSCVNSRVEPQFTVERGLQAKQENSITLYERRAGTLSLNATTPFCWR